VRWQALSQDCSTGVDFGIDLQTTHKTKYKALLRCLSAKDPTSNSRHVDDTRMLSFRSTMRCYWIPVIRMTRDTIVKIGPNCRHLHFAAETLRAKARCPNPIWQIPSLGLVLVRGAKAVMADSCVGFASPRAVLGRPKTWSFPLPQDARSWHRIRRTQISTPLRRGSRGATIALVTPLGPPSQDLLLQAGMVLCGPVLNVFTVIMVIRIVLTWYPQTDLKKVPWIFLAVPTEPLLRATREVIKPVGGVDISPIVWVAISTFAHEILMGPQGILVLLSRK
jgi:YggT family protein